MAQGVVEGLLGLTGAADLSLLESRSNLGVALLPSAAAVANTEIQATPLAERITPETYALVAAGTEELLGRYADDSGAVRVLIRATLVAARNL